MSKKQSNKKKVILKLNPEETAIILPYEIALHISETYDFLSMDTEDEYVSYYKDVADMIRLQASENKYEMEDDDYYDEW